MMLWDPKAEMEQSSMSCVDPTLEVRLAMTSSALSSWCHHRAWDLLVGVPRSPWSQLCQGKGTQKGWQQGSFPTIAGVVVTPWPTQQFQEQSIPLLPHHSLSDCGCRSGGGRGDEQSWSNYALKAEGAGGVLHGGGKVLGRPHGSLWESCLRVTIKPKC